MNLIIKPSPPLQGETYLPGDKSIAHRSVLLAALANGSSHIHNFPPADDPLATVQTVQQLGIEIESIENKKGHTRTSTADSLSLTIHGQGLDGLKAPIETIDCRNAGTAMRLLAGMLAGQCFDSILDGSDQLRQRPMRRITDPLNLMGARITDTDGHAPLRIAGRSLGGIDYRLPVASAQVKSALILAGLYAETPTIIHEPGPARDHTERMLRGMGAGVHTIGPQIRVQPLKSTDTTLTPLNLSIPGDFSSGAFLIVAGLLVAGSQILLGNVGVNPTRTGLLDVLHRMGANILQLDARDAGGEPVADLQISHSKLHGTQIAGDTVVRMIDEFPILAVAATQAQGTTTVQDADELRVKESDRISCLADGLSKMGAQIEERPDGFLIQGPTPLQGCVVDSYGDHRLGMALAIAGLIADGETIVRGADAIADSFPGFESTLAQLTTDQNPRGA
jgi:3-phosphoshikimate 1-carboxyvinyltransferase